MTNEQLATLRALAKSATPGPWVVGVPHEQDPRKVYWDDAGDLKIVANASQFRGFADARYIAAVSPDVLLGLLDALDGNATERAHALEQQRAAFAKTLSEAETAAYLRAREDALTAINNAGDYAHRMEADRDELAAEIAAYQGRPEGALPGWESIGSASNGYRLLGQGWFVFVQLIGAGPRWQAYFSGDAFAAFALDADSPRAAMRAAEAAARARGLLPPEGS